MKFFNRSFTALLAFSALLFNSCKKQEFPKDLGDRGQTIVKFITSPNSNGSNYNLVTIEVANTPQAIGVVDIRRDIPNEGELNKSMTVTIKDDPAAITAFNIANGTPFVALPANLYTVDASNPRTGSDYTVTFQPGEFAKNLKITVPNATQLDLTNRYAIGLTIVAAVTGADGRVSFENRTTVVEIGLKNKYDGIYEITGEALRAGDPVLSGPTGPYERGFATAGPNSVQWVGTIPWANGSGSSLPAGYEPLLVVDPATNKITSITSPGGGGISPAPGFDQRYDPATRTFHFQFTYGAGPASRLFTMHAKWIKPRP